MCARCAEERVKLKKLLRSALLTICLCVALLLPAYAAGTELELAAPDALPAVGETFNVTIAISGNPGLGAVQMTLAFDKAVVECIEISMGTVLSDSVVGGSNPSGGSGAKVAAVAFDHFSGDGILATYTFKVRSAGNPAFALKDIVLIGTDRSDINHTVNIPSHVAPEQPMVQPPVPVQPAPGTATKPETTDKPEEEDITAPLPQTFTDVPGSHWASAYIEKAASMGLIRGYSDGSFRPGNQVTRAQFVTMLWRMAGSPESSGKTPFTDIVGINAEFRSAIAWAYEQGYINGRTATTFAPSDPLSRQAAMKVLFLYAGGKSGQEVLFTEIYNDRFTDSAGLPDWARTSLYWAVYNELISGTTPTTLGATNAATRGQLAKILVNYAEKIGTR